MREVLVGGMLQFDCFCEGGLVEFFVEALGGFDGFHDCLVDLLIELEFRWGDL